MGFRQEIAGKKWHYNATDGIIIPSLSRCEMEIKCATCGKEYADLSEAYRCCVREEEDHLISDVDIKMDAPLHFLLIKVDVDDGTLAN